MTFKEEISFAKVEIPWCYISASDKPQTLEVYNQELEDGDTETDADRVLYCCFLSL